MCYGALARYEAHTPVETLSHPPQQTCPELALFWELIQRQAYTLYPLGLAKLVQFLLARDGSSGTDVILGQPVSHVGIVTLSVPEWPKLRAALDRGQPVILCLVRSGGTSDLTENHQVVAIGYRWAGGGHPTVFIYDPNHPEEEQTLTFSLDDPDSIHGIESDGKSMRGFFVNPLPTEH